MNTTHKHKGVLHNANSLLLTRLKAGVSSRPYNQIQKETLDHHHHVQYCNCIGQFTHWQVETWVVVLEEPE